MTKVHCNVHACNANVSGMCGNFYIKLGNSDQSPICQTEDYSIIKKRNSRIKSRIKVESVKCTCGHDTFHSYVGSNCRYCCKCGTNLDYAVVK